MNKMLVAAAMAFTTAGAAFAEPIDVDLTVDQTDSGYFQVNYSYLIQAANVAAAVVNQTSGGNIEAKFRDELVSVEEKAFNAATSVFGNVAVGEPDWE